MESIANGILKFPLDLEQTHQTLVAQRDVSGTVAHAQRAISYYKLPEDAGACLEPVSDAVEAPSDNDTPEMAQDTTESADANGDGDSGRVSVSGTLDEVDADFFVLTEPENPDDYTFFEIIVETPGEIEVLLPPFFDEPVAHTSQVFINQDDFTEVDKVTVGLRNRGESGDFDQPLPYELSLIPSPPLSGIVLKNVTETETFVMRVVTNEALVNGGDFVQLAPGEIYREYFGMRLTGFNILDKHALSNSQPSPNDQGFDISINQGREQVFEFDLFSDSFFQGEVFRN